ncbi:hypothetical protein EEB15_06140 [Ramlibacter sp. WS9]|nr:hypothetical protein EEB15_06140 [Ramlibacter sp. WS9]
MFEYQAPQGLLRLHITQPGPLPTNAAPPAQASTDVAVQPATASSVLRSPGMGRLLLRHPLAGDAMVRVGDWLSKGHIVAVLQAGELLAPVEADRDGKVARLLAAEGELVGYGAPVLEWA